MGDRFAIQLKEKEQLVDYLSSTYDVSEERAQEIVEQAEHQEPINQGITVGSFVYFVGDKIADDEGLELLEADDVMEDDDDDE